MACDFVAIDFETANETRGSACSVGVTQVSGGRLVGEGAQLINPEQPFNGYNTYIHGISEEDVANAPTFAQLWSTLSALLDGRIVVAHNASFDISVMRNSAAHYTLTEGPTFDVFCTYRLAKRVWPSLPSYSLGYLAPAQGIQFDHHDAAEDARACALLVEAMYQSAGVTTLHALTELIGARPGRVTSSSYEPLHQFAHGTDLAAAAGNAQADQEHPLYGKSVCFTGGMESMPRRVARDEVVAVGCDFRNSVSKTLTYLVIGDADFVAFTDGWQTGKLKRALELIDVGAGIEVLPERGFLELLHEGKE